MLINGKTPEGIEAGCEGCCPAHSRSVRSLHRRTRRALAHSLKRREDRRWRSDARAEGVQA